MPRSVSFDTPSFWRDCALPFIEARTIADGRKVCYAPHFHETFSIGAVTGGACHYLHGKSTHRISAGTVVVMNPGEVHACNPLTDEAWSYVMFFVEAAWLGELQHQAGATATASFQPIAITHSADANAFQTLIELHATLTDPQGDMLQKQCDVINVFRALPQILGLAPERRSGPDPRVQRAAEFLDHHYQLPVSLEDLCEAASLSASHLIRSFQQTYLMTPHAYLINRRIQYARRQLRAGQPIADVAQECGFADQAHLQRVFKKHIAATPGQYRSACLVSKATATPPNLSIAAP